MSTALVTLSAEGARLARLLAGGLPDCHVFVHESAASSADVQSFSSVTGLTARIFKNYAAVIFIAPCGVAVRAIAPLLRHKITDPAVVVVDVRGRWAVSLLSGHEGGANDLALSVSNILFAEPVITTTTEALKDLIVGVGCRKETAADQIVAAVKTTLADAALDLSMVRLLSSADVKANEKGLLAAASELGVPLRFISSQEIRSCAQEFEHSDFVNSKVDVPAVAEPAALLAGRRTQLVVRRTRHNGVTVAVARESSLS
ncbi:MAG: cobalamin biosynthesis protein [Desulfomonile sp.]|nr:cobalamin biosynthesis protein [Desulfomonile sp.]